VSAVFVLLATGCSSAGSAPSPSVAASSARAASSTIAPALDAIRETDLHRDMFAMGGDAMRGREAGTLDEMRATGWVAEQAREAGLQPAGDDGTFFQWWPMRRTRLSMSSEISLAGKPLQLWRDAVALSNQPVTADLPVVYLTDTSALEHTDVKGKAVAMVVTPIPTQPAAQFTIRGNYQATTAAMLRQHVARIAQAGGAAAILISDGSSALDDAFVATATVSSRGSYAIDSAGGPAGTFARPPTQNQNAPGAGRAGGGGAGGGAGGGRGRGNATTIPALWVRNAALESVRSPNAKLVANIVSETFYYPSGNVIGVVRGTDPRLAHEYVLYSGHQDHDGTRYVVNGDSI
jgi:hypothetical protein